MRILSALFLAVSASLAVGCSYQMIPDESVRQLEAVPPECHDQAQAAAERAKGYLTNAQAAGDRDDLALQHAWAKAHAEAAITAKNATTTGGAVADATKTARPPLVVIGEGIQTIAPHVPPAGGVPWDAITYGLGGLVVAVGGLAEKNRRAKVAAEKDACVNKQAHAWEEAAIADPELGGGTDNLNYADPKLYARARRDVATGKLAQAAFDIIFSK